MDEPNKDRDTDMGTQKDRFAEIIRKDQAGRNQQQWQGTFLDYLEMVRKDPSISRLAHAHLYDDLGESVFLAPQSSFRPVQ